MAGSASSPILMPGIGSAPEPTGHSQAVAEGLQFPSTVACCAAQQLVLRVNGEIAADGQSR